MTWWTLLKQFTHLADVDHLLEIDEDEEAELDETVESLLHELDGNLGQYANVERPLSLQFIQPDTVGHSIDQIKQLTGMIHRMGTSGANLTVNRFQLELSREIDNINYSFIDTVQKSLSFAFTNCLYLNTNLSDLEPKICLKPPEGANELVGNWMILTMSSLEQLMQVIPGFQFFLEDVELWRRWGTNGENLEDGLTENMPDFDKFRAQAIKSYERGEHHIDTREFREGISKTDLLDKLGWQYFTDGIFNFHITYWTPVERGQEYSNRIVIPR